MSYDIYGNTLRRGFCEVHPHVNEEYPCSLCYAETNNKNARKQQEQEYHRQQEKEHDRIQELESLLRDKLKEDYEISIRMSKRIKESQQSEIQTLKSERDELKRENSTLHDKLQANSPTSS
jgi:hypothetical protein